MKQNRKGILNDLTRKPRNIKKGIWSIINLSRLKTPFGKHSLGSIHILHGRTTSGEGGGENGDEEGRRRDEVSLNEAGNTLQLKCFVKYDIFMITQDIKQKVGEYKPLDTFIGNW